MHVTDQNAPIFTYLTFSVSHACKFCKLLDKTIVNCTGSKNFGKLC